MKAIRFDVGGLQKGKRRHDGTVRLDARLTRSGIFLYSDGNGGIRREYRPPEEVFKADSMESLKLVPVTNNHPTTGVRSDNARRHAVGAIGQDVREDGGFVRATMAVHDADTIQQMDEGKEELSCGYKCFVDMTPGTTPDGLRYDAVQRDIVYDHVAIVDRGRAGSDVRARLDAYRADGFDVGIMEEDENNRADDGATNEPPERRGDENMKFTVKIDGIDYQLEGDESAKQAVMKLHGSIEGAKAKADAAKAAADQAVNEAQEKCDKESARADAAETKLKETEEARTDAADKLPDLVKARVQLEKDAAKILDEVKGDASDADIKKEAVAKAMPNLDLEGKSDAYIEGLFDHAVAQADNKTKKEADAKNDAKETAGALNSPNGKPAGKEGDTLTAKQKYDAKMAELASTDLGAFVDPNTGDVKVSK